MAPARRPGSRFLQFVLTSVLFVWASLVTGTFRPWTFAWKKAQRPTAWERRTPFDDALEGRGSKQLWRLPGTLTDGGPTSKLSKIPVVYEADYVDADDCERAQAELDYRSVAGRMVRVSAIKPEWRRNRTATNPTVRVQGVHPDVPQQEVRALLEETGEVESLRVYQDVAFGEVRFRNSNTAYDVKVALDGSRLRGNVLRSELDCTTNKLNLVLVHGLGAGTGWQELKDHIQPMLQQRNQISWCRIHQGWGPTFRVRFSRHKMAQEAFENAHRTRIPGYADLLDVCFPYHAELEPGEIRVARTHPNTTEEEVQKYFSYFGNVQLVEKIIEELPPEFKESQLSRIDA